MVTEPRFVMMSYQLMRYQFRSCVFVVVVVVSKVSALQSKLFLMHAHTQKIAVLPDWVFLHRLGGFGLI